MRCNLQCKVVVRDVSYCLNELVQEAKIFFGFCGNVQGPKKKMVKCANALHFK